MEILNTIEYVGEYKLLIVVLGIGLIMSAALFIYCLYLMYDSGCVEKDVMVFLVLAILSFSFLYFFDSVVREDGVTVEHEAKVTDFNEVYNNGYKIVKQRGEIYILRKD